MSEIVKPEVLADAIAAAKTALLQVERVLPELEEREAARERRASRRSTQLTEKYPSLNGRS